MEVTDEGDTTYHIVGNIDAVIAGQPDDGLIVFAFNNFIIQQAGTYRINIHIYRERDWLIGTVFTPVVVFN